MGVIAGIVFDLDDTLYLEREYVRSGFRHVAGVAGVTAGIEPQTIFKYLWSAFENGVRGNTFALLLEAYPAVAHRYQVTDLVSLYRHHIPSIRMHTDANNLLQKLRTRGIRIGVLSDGYLRAQEAKVEALGLREVCSPVILTDTWGRDYWKPHSRGFEEISAFWSLEPGQLVYVGDNPEKDFVGPKRLGWTAVRIRMNGQLRQTMQPACEQDEPSFEVNTFDDLCRWIEAH